VTAGHAAAELVLAYFRLLHRDPVEIRRGVWQVWLDESLARELDGWRGRERLFQFTFDRKLAEAYGAELIAPGSYRLSTILQAVREKARLARAHLPHDLFHEPSIRSSMLYRLAPKAGAAVRHYVLRVDKSFSPYLWVAFQISRLTHTRHDELFSSCVDLCAGRISPMPIAMQLFVNGPPPSGLVRRRRLSYKQAYEKLCRHITSELETEDSSWAEEAWQLIAEEQRRLAHYFEDCGEQAELESRRKQLVENYAPRILVKPIRGALLYIPLFTYKLVEVGQSERIVYASYDPLTHEIVLDDPHQHLPKRSNSS